MRAYQIIMVVQALVFLVSVGIILFRWEDFKEGLEEMQSEKERFNDR